MDIQLNRTKKIIAEIEAARSKITTDRVAISIGEIISLNRDGDLIIPKAKSI